MLGFPLPLSGEGKYATMLVPPNRSRYAGTTLHCDVLQSYLIYKVLYFCFAAISLFLNIAFGVGLTLVTLVVCHMLWNVVCIR